VIPFARSLVEIHERPNRLIFVLSQMIESICFNYQALRPQRH